MPLNTRATPSQGQVRGGNDVCQRRIGVGGSNAPITQGSGKPSARTLKKEKRSIKNKENEKVVNQEQ